MFTDEQSRSSGGQSGFVRRNMSNPRFDGEKTAPSYQNTTDYSSQPAPSYGSGGGYSGQPRTRYNQPQRSNSGEGFSGGYNRNSGSGGYGSNRTGGYQRNSAPRDNSGGASSDRVVRQNDQIIKLLREIRDRLPPPPPGTAQYDSPDASANESSYKAEPPYNSVQPSDGNAAGSEADDSGNVSLPSGADVSDDADKFNS